MWNYDLAVQRCCCGSNTEFKIYDATVAKTSLKIASSSFCNLFRHYVSLFNFWKLAELRRNCILFLSIKYANVVASSLQSRRWS